MDGADIAMLNTTGAFDTGGNEGHIWANRPVMGQTFTTLGDAGYTLTSATLQNRNNTINNNVATWTLRVGTVSGNTFSPIATETSNNSISYAPLDYLTFTFASPVALSANTVYGFDWTTTGSGFVTENNVDSNYAGGTNFRSGGNHIPDDANLLFPGDDRVFHLDMTSEVPEPSTLVLAVMGLIGLAGLRRRRR